MKKEKSTNQGGHDTWPWSLETLPTNIPLSIRDLIGRKFRVIAFGKAKTEDYVAGRVTFYLDKENHIKSIEIEPDNAVDR